MRPTPKAGGFTLIEVIVAVAVFSLAMALAYGGLNAIVDARRQLDDEADTLARLQFAVSLLERDLRSAVQRPVRDRYGQRQPALSLRDGRLSLTRGGYANALAASRAELQRVDWFWRQDELLRQSAAQLVGGDAAESVELLDRIEGLQIEVMGADLRWQERWPPLGGSAESLPQAVRLRLVGERFGRVERVFELASATRAAPPAP